LKKTRIDKLLLDRGLVDSREKARSLIMAGNVLVEDTPVLKAGTPVADDASVRLRGAGHPFVGRGGVKLEGALVRFKIDPSGWVAADIGASTGGFTDCLLRRGAARVYAIDVDTDQLDWRLRSDPRVMPIRGNARYLERDWVPEPVALAVVDVSFISVSKVLEALPAIILPGGDVVALVKPQFEVGRGRVGKGGVVRDPELQREAVEAVIREASKSGFACEARCPAPITGKQGNQEFFIKLRRQ